MMTNESESAPIKKKTITRGPKFIQAPMDRIVPMYPISETELESLSHNEKDASMWVGILTLITGLLAGCLWDCINLPDNQKVSMTAKAFLWSGGFVILFSAMMAWRYRNAHNKLLKQIKQHGHLTK